MSKLTELLEGVDVTWHSLGEVATFRRGSFPQPYGNSEWYDGEGAMPFVQVVDVDTDMKLVPNTKNKISRLAQTKSVYVPKGTVIVTLQGSIGRVAITQYESYVDRTIAIFEHFKIEINKKYFAYQLEEKFKLEKENARGSTIKTITKEEFTKFLIPIPPVSIQKEIVRILDTFTERTDTLINELTTELEARKKQYNYYRDRLLSFKEGEVEWKTLGEVILSLKTGLNPRQNFQLNTNDATGFYVTVREIQNGNIKFSEKTDRVNERAIELINNRSNLDAGDILFSGTGTVGRTAVIYKKPVDWNIKEGVYVIKPIPQIINSKYLSHLLNTNYIIKEYSKKIVGSPVISLPMNDFKKLSIPIPSIEEQERIVAILDKLENLTTSISEALPKEIALRKKQYEYYRDRLLTFK